ncbi:hypothetical protein NN561_011850 [Cricetulus griseus]
MWWRCPAAAASSGPPTPGVPPTRGRGCWDSSVGVLFGGFCLGARRVPPPGTLPTGSLVAVSFFALTLPLSTPPCPDHSHARPDCDFSTTRLALAAAKFRPSARAVLGCGATVTCVRFRRGVGVVGDPASPLVVSSHFAL